MMFATAWVSDGSTSKYQTRHLSNNPTKQVIPPIGLLKKWTSKGNFCELYSWFPILAAHQPKKDLNKYSHCRVSSDPAKPTRSLSLRRKSAWARLARALSCQVRNYLQISTRGIVQLGGPMDAIQLFFLSVQRNYSIHTHAVVYKCSLDDNGFGSSSVVCFEAAWLGGVGLATFWIFDLTEPSLVKPTPDLVKLTHFS